MHSSVRSDPTDHYVYAYRDTAGRILYIGSTRSPERRLLYHHSSSKHWHRFAASVEHHGPYCAGVALLIEDEWIRQEAPPYNADSNPAEMSWRARNERFRFGRLRGPMEPTPAQRYEHNWPPLPEDQLAPWRERRSCLAYFVITGKNRSTKYGLPDFVD